MVDRIKKVMEYYQEKPGDFADALGVSRSNLTHVFSGRNQPSLDFARRVLMAFPDISPEWLIMGAGDMIKPAGSDVESSKKAYVQTDLFASAEEQLGWGLEDENNEELGMRNGELTVRDNEMWGDDTAVVQSERSEASDNNVELGMRNGESTNEARVETNLFVATEQGGEKGNDSFLNEELGMRNEELNDRGNESRSSVTSVAQSGRSETSGNNEELNVKDNGSRSYGELTNVESEEDGVDKSQSAHNVNSATFVKNRANNPTQTEQQKNSSTEKAPKMDTKQTDTKTVKPRRTVYSTPSESKIQPHAAPMSRISDSREPVATSEKQVVKIIFFYDDDSFKIYHP